MRLKPRTVFLGIVAFGLPIALTTGWTLAQGGTPGTGPGIPGGAGGLGTAPRVSVRAVPSASPLPAVQPSLRQVADAPQPSAVLPAVPGRTRPAPPGTPTRPPVSFSPPPVPTPTAPSAGPTGEPTDPPPTGDPSPNP